jgi:Rrf2 family protein
MNFSKKAEYALRAVLAMSRSAPGTVFSIQSLSHEERIPLKFLEQILLVLRKGGLLQSKRGAGGGYHLGRSPSRITLGEILELVDGPLDILPGGASLSTGLNAIFAQLRGDLRQWLADVSIADVLQREQQGGAASFEI